MADEPMSPAEREQLLDGLVAAYFEAAEGGQRPDSAQWLARHPELAQELAEFFAAQDRLERVAAPLRQVAQAAAAPDETIDCLRTSDDPTAAPPVGSFGDYELLEELGQGGGGVVFRARQRGAGREVALKMVLAGRAATRAERDRFRTEAEVVAGLDHPHIVPLYEVGEYDGTPYFSMKFVPGGSLAEAVAGGGWARGKEPQRRAAQVLAQVARAVHHAHQRGVLHRDLKPANVLLDERGEPHVTDFGLAKRLEGGAAGHTQTGAVVGTPSYMAPEQARGDRAAVTTATDVYGLGAVLYALLAGRPPFREPTVLETLRQLQEREPERPGKVRAGVDRDLETVCLKCLRKEPGQRYASTEAVAEDLERWLRGEPIQARPIGRVARVWRWCRRNPVVAGLTGAVALLLVAAAVGLVVGALMIWREQARTKVALAEARANFRKARDAVDHMLSRVAAEKLAHVPQMQEVRRELLEKALEFYQGFLEQAGDDAEVRSETGRTYVRVGNIRSFLGQHAEAESAYRRAVELLRPLAADFPAEPQYRHHLADSHHGLAVVLAKARRAEEAEAAYREAVALHEQLANALPAEPRYRRGLARNHNDLGALLITAGRDQEAEAALRAARDLRGPLAADFPGVDEYRYDLAVTHHALGEVHRRAGRTGDAEAEFGRARAIMEKLVAEFSGVPAYLQSLARIHLNRGWLLQMIGRADEAEAAFRRAKDLLGKLVADFSTVPAYRQELARAHHDLGGLLRRADRADEAEAAFGKALVLWDRLIDAFPKSLAFPGERANTLNSLGVLFQNAGRLKEAEDTHRQVLKVRRELAARWPKVPSQRQGLGYSLDNLGWVLGRLGRPREAEEHLREALAVQRKLAADFPHVPEYWQELAVTWNHLGGLLEAVGRIREAGDAFAESVRHYERLVKEHGDVPRYKEGLAANSFNLARNRFLQGRFREAVPDYRRALKLAPDKVAANNGMAWFRATCPDPRFRDGREAVALAQKAVKLAPKNWVCWRTLGVAHYRTGDWAAAVTALEEARALRQGGASPATCFFLAMAQWRLGQEEQARQWYDLAAGWMDRNPSQTEELRRFRAEAKALLLGKEPARTEAR
jgi:eukaryotic-like serine/threonine-protein kinase